MTTVNLPVEASAKPAEGNQKNIPVNVEIHKGVDLYLFAPYNEIVQIIGDFTDWKPIDMVRADNGWWHYQSNLPDGDYHYKFRVKSKSYFCLDQMVDVFDPYCLSVTKDEAENSIVHVRNGKGVAVQYDWKHDDVPLPTNEKLIMYELHVGDFSEKHQFTGVIDKLDYLKDLGINCIELMPVKQFPGKGWGYSLRSLFAVENAYGQPEELCRLVDEAHARGIRVIVDGVYNHADPEAPLTKIDYQYWFYKDNPDPPQMQWGPKYNYFHYDENLKVFPARKYVEESIRFWVETFHIDGIRFDATAAIRDFKILRELADSAYEKIGTMKPFLTVAEHVPEDHAVAGREDGAPVDAAWHESLGKLLQAVVIDRDRDNAKPWDLDSLAAQLNPAANGYRKGCRSINYITNHDYKRIMQMLGEDAHVFHDAAFRRIAMGAALLLMSPGVPLIWMGQEFGFSSDKSLDPRPLDWSLLNNQRNKNLQDRFRRLIQLRNEHHALQNDSFEMILEDRERRLFGFKRWNGDGNVIVVVANLLDKPGGDFEIKNVGLEDGAWNEALSGKDVVVKDGVLKDSLAPSEVKVFIKKG